MRVELLCLDVDGTLTDGSLIYGFVGNSPLGLHSADLANFGEQQTQSLVVSPKFSKNHESQTENPSVVDSALAQNLGGNQTKVAESTLDSAESQNLVKNNHARSAHLLKASSGVGEGVVREGEGSDFAIQAPAPSLKKNARGEKGDFNAGLSAQGRREIDSTDSQNLHRLPRSHSLARNDEFIRDSSPMAQNDNNNAPKSKSPQDEFAEVLKVFNAKDGLALAYWCKTLKRNAAIITGKKSEILRQRASELGIKFLFMGIKDKGEILQGLKKDLALDSAQVACVGDDLNDISMFAESSLNFAPNDCASHLKTLPNITLLNANGGCGAVREALEIILQKEGIYEDFIGFFAR